MELSDRVKSVACWLTVIRWLVALPCGGLTHHDTHQSTAAPLKRAGQSGSNFVLAGLITVRRIGSFRYLLVIASYIADQDSNNEFLKREIAVLDKQMGQIAT
jgi:hypothetical protein